MSYFAVTYTYGPDLVRQDELRPEHRAFLRRLADDGVIAASGPLLGTSPATALLVVRGASEEDVRRLLTSDPFQADGQVAQVDVTEWNPVIGVFADAS